MAINDIEEQLRQLQQQEASIAQRKAELEAEMARQAELDKRLDEVVQNSGYRSARDLVQALVSKYGIRIARAPQSGDKPRRKRTRITATLRDDIKARVNAGSSMNSVSKEIGLSYTVVAKIMKGQYDAVV
jgi:succinate dehydrogenase/fumarate reductase flavoprotein subunit